MPRRNLIWIAAVVALSLMCRQVLPNPGDDEELYQFYRILVDAVDQIERNYVTKVDRKKLLEAALRGMLRELDQYSAYIGPEEYKRFERQTRGKFGGVGIQISQDPDTHELVVISPLVGTPAYRAGILAGDRIVEIDGKPTKKLTMQQAVELLTGKPGSQVTIKVRREGESKPLEIKIVREEIKIPSVLGDTRRPDGSWEWIIDKEHKIAYIRLNAFIASTAADLEKALEEARREGMRALVLDLRFNPGGLLQAAVRVADLFLKKGDLIVSTKGRNVPERRWYATGRGKFTDIPMAVLVNRFSASASEIVAAALQDHKRAVIVGQRTWGKGSVQNVIELEDGQRAIKLTTAEYHRPSGHNIHRRPGAKESDEWGVMPDKGFKVEMSLLEMAQYRAYRQARDIVRRNSPGKSEGGKGRKGNGQKGKNEKAAHAAKKHGAPPPEFKDKQLLKALEYLRKTLEQAQAKPKAAAPSRRQKGQEKRAKSEPETSKAQPKEKNVPTKK